MIRNKDIDDGKAFDWGKTSQDYAKYRDIYPPEFYERLYKAGIGLKDQRILDLGTGTGVIPRNLQRYKSHFVGVDIAENQIKYAKILSEHLSNIHYLVGSAEEIDFDENSFDVALACQCFWYFNKEILFPRLNRLLKPDGKFAILTMSWLPYEDSIAKLSEDLVLEFSPSWAGCNYQRNKLVPPENFETFFELDELITFDVNVPFTRESWNGRMKACRGVGASLPANEIEEFERRHIELLEKNAPDEFEILHYATMTILSNKKTIKACIKASGCKNSVRDF